MAQVWLCVKIEYVVQNWRERGNSSRQGERKERKNLVTLKEEREEREDDTAALLVYTPDDGNSLWYIAS